MSWSYRVVKKNGCLGIHEAYYDDSGNISSLSIEPVSPVFEELEDLRADLELMLESLQTTIVDFENIRATPESP